jgi:hypothetical protein
VQKRNVLFPSKITVVENGSVVCEELVKGFLESLPITYEYVAKGNKSAALNHVLQTTNDEELLVFFDDDIQIVDDNIFSKYRQAFEKFGVDCYYGGEFVPEYEVKPGLELIPFMPGSNVGYKSDIREPHQGKVHYFLGFNWAVQANQLKLIGGFDPNYGPGAKSGARGQETDAQERMLKRGLKAITVPEATVAHFVPEKYVTYEWVWERRLLSGMRRGRIEGSLAKMIYWWCQAKKHELFYGDLASSMRSATYLGHVAGWKTRKYFE